MTASTVVRETAREALIDQIEIYESLGAELRAMGDSDAAAAAYAKADAARRALRAL